MLQPIWFANSNNKFARGKVYWIFFFPLLSNVLNFWAPWWSSSTAYNFLLCPRAAAVPSSTSSSFGGAAIHLAFLGAAAGPQWSHPGTRGARASSNKSGTICVSGFPVPQPKIHAQPSSAVTALPRACLPGGIKATWEEVVRDAPCESIFGEPARGWPFPFEQECKMPKSACQCQEKWGGRWMCHGAVVQREQQEPRGSMQAHGAPCAAASQLWWPWRSVALHHQPHQARPCYAGLHSSPSSVPRGRCL